LEFLLEVSEYRGDTFVWYVTREEELDDAPEDA
jgi:hypothetical protein